MDTKIDQSQPLLDPNQRMAEFVTVKKIDEEVEHIELRDAEVPAVTTTTDAGQSETLQVATEGCEKNGKKKKCRIARPPKQPCQPLSVGLNVLDRDEKLINGQVHIMFDDVIAEPDGSHSFENIWRGNFVIFHYTKIWFYKFFTAVFGWPICFMCGFIFALLSAFNNFIFTPFFKLFALFWFWFGRLWGTMFHEIMDPIFESFGKCFGGIRYFRGDTNSVGTNTTCGKPTGTNGSVGQV